VAVVFADGSAHRWLTAAGCLSYSRPIWSPDSSRLYVAGADSCQGGTAHTWVVIADGAHAPTPCHLPAGALPTSISRDGRTLVVSLPPGAGQRWNRTGIVHADGTGLRTLGTQGTMGLALSPSGRTVAAAKVLREGDDKVTVQAGLLDSVIGSWTALPVTQAAGGWGSARPVEWSPDGKYLYYQWYGYQRDGRDTPPRLYRITSSGTSRTDVTPRIGAWNTSLSLQPRHG
jgi:hypothetical protein